jgi:hypothetical protein
MHTGAAEVQLQAFLTSELDKGGWSASRLSVFTPGTSNCYLLKVDRTNWS